MHKIIRNIIIPVLMLVILLASSSYVKAETKTGYCGSTYPYTNATWVLDDDGTLTISGTGSIRDRWNEYKDIVKKIIINDGITSIQITYTYTALTEVIMADSVTTMNSYAFSNCSSLQKVKLSNNLTSIPDYAFYYCPLLSNIIIPKSVQTIGQSAFNSCSALSTVIFSTGLKTIGTNAFSSCNLKSIHLPEGLTTISSYAFYSSSGFKIDIYIPESVTSIAGDAFRTSQTWYKARITIYCYEYSYADYWATDNYYNIVYLDATAAKVTDFSIPSEIWLLAKDSTTVSITNVKPTDATFTGLIWISDNDATASVSDGVVTGKKPGDVIITAIEGDISRQCTVHVCYPVTQIAFTEDKVFLNVGDSYTLTANVTTRTQSLVNQLVEFSSSNSSIATVDDSGMVKALSHGTAIITATAANGISDNVTIGIHTPTKTATVKPTCTQTGLTEAIHCSVCGEVLEAPEVMPALGHDSGEWITVKEPTKTEEGFSELRCTACGEVLDTKEIPATGSTLVGDLNDDGKVDLRDSLLMLQHLAGWDVTFNKTNADINGDGSVDLRDSLFLLQYLAGWESAYIK